jgi:hypothetical protein
MRVVACGATRGALEMHSYGDCSIGAPSSSCLRPEPASNKERSNDAHSCHRNVLHPCQIHSSQECERGAFSVATQFTVTTGKRMNFREECHWSHACSLQANMRGIQWNLRRGIRNGILECGFLSETAHRTQRVSCYVQLVPSVLLAS